MSNYTEVRATLEDALSYYSTGELKVLKQEANNGLTATVTIDKIAETMPNPFADVVSGRDHRIDSFPRLYFQLLGEICAAIIEEREFNEQLEAGTITMNQNK